MTVSVVYRVGGLLPSFLRDVVWAPPASAAPPSPTAPRSPLPPDRNAVAPAMPWLQFPARSEAVAELQRALHAAGIDCGPVDGYFGPVTERAVRQFQTQRGLVVDGQVGPQTWGALGRVGLPRHGASSIPLPPALAPVVTPEDQLALRNRLLANRTNWASGLAGQCLSYANRLVVDNGGRALVGSEARGVRVTHEGRGQPVAHLEALVREGVLRVGDVVLATPEPGQEHLVRHWFTYLGNGEFMDQRGIKSAAEMARFLPRRRIDAIHHPFG